MNNISCRVLLIDDGQNNYLVVRDLLADIATTEFDLEWVNNYQAARQALVHQQYDICLFAYGLGGATGLELMREFAGGEMPFILLTAEENHEVDVAATQAGAADYLLTDHINAPLLERSIRYAIERKKTEAALLHAQRFSQATVDALPGHIAVIDSLGTILAVNATWREFAASNGFIGADSDIGTNYLEVCDQSDAADGRTVAAYIRAVLRGEETISALEYPCHSATAQRWFQASATRFPGDGPLHVVVAHENITQRKLAEQQTEVRSHLLNVVGQAVVVTDSAGTITYWNAFAEKLYGWPASEALGRQILDMMPIETNQEQAAEIIARLARGESWSGEFMVQKRDGTPFPVYVSNTPVLNEAGQVGSIIGLSFDITQSKDAEERLHQSESNLAKAQQIAHLGSWELDLLQTGDFYANPLYWSEEVFRIFGYEPGQIEVSSENFFEAAHPDDREHITATVTQALRDGQSKRFDHRILLPDGEERIVQEQLEIVFDVRTEKPWKMVGTVQDITERKRAEGLLKESQQRLALATESASIGTWDWDVVANKLVWDAQMFALYGVREEEFSGAYEAWQNGLHSEDRNEAEAAIRAALDGSRDFNPQFRVVWPSGEMRYIEAHAIVQRAEDGSPLRMIGVNWDITERKQTEEALRRSEALFRTLINSSWDAFHLIGSNGQITYESPAVKRLLGYEPEEMVGHNAVEFVHPDDIKEIMVGGMALLDSPGAMRTVNLRVRHKNGSWRWVESYEVNLVDHPDVGAVAVNYHDITERKLAEESLRQNEEEFRTLAEAMPQLVWVTRPDGWHVHFNQRWMDYTGLTLEESLGFGWNTPFHPDDRDRAAKIWQQATKIGEAYEIEYRLRRADGAYRWMLGRALPMRDATGEIVKWFGTCTDIHDLKLAQDELRASEERFQIFMDNSPAIAFIMDEQSHFVYVNQPFERDMGMKLDAKSRLSVFDVWPEDIARVMHDQNMSVLAGNRFSPLTMAIPDAGGQIQHWTTWKFLLVNNQGRRLVAGLAIDVTEQERTSLALRASEARLQTFMDNTPAQVFMKDRQGHYIYANKAVERLQGVPAPELLGQTAYDRFPPQIADPLHRHDLQVFATGQAHQFEEVFVSADGHLRHEIVAKFLLPDAEGQQILAGVGVDITEQKKAEEALRKANDELELRVEKRTIELQAQVLERERAEREVRAQARQHEAVAELGRRALLDIDLNTLLEGTVALIANTLEVDMCVFWERLPESETLRFRAGVGLNEQMQLTLDKKIGDNTQIGYSALLNEPVIADDLTQETRFQPALYLVEMGITSLITMPVHNGVLYGILAVCSPHRQKFNKNEVFFLQSVANVLSSALARYQTEAEILQLNTNLQGANESLRVENIERQMTMETLRQVADALQLAKEEAEHATQQANAANQAKSEFLSRMSHELRTPMNAILGYGQILGMRDHVPDIEKEVEAILKAGRHLLDLINEVLDISRIEAGHLSLSLEPVPVGPTTRIALDLVQPLTTVRGIQLVHENSTQEDSTKHAEHHVFADQQRIKQVLVNLLSNAIKYNREGGQVFVSTSMVPGEPVKYGDYGEIECSGKMRFLVRDTGPGIAQSDFAKLFLPFERLGAERTGVEGTGIGLSLCKRLVEAMNGDIGVESVPGVGSTFWVEFPLVSVASGMRATVEETIALPEATPRQETPGDALTILYIEDNTSNFAVVKYAFALQERVINLLGAEQGSVGFDLARSHQPDLILLDLHLPDVMGDVVLQRLQAEPSTCAIPIIILSADATPGQIERLLAAGATAYLTKPLDLPRFFSVLEETLDEREQ